MSAPYRYVVPGWRVPFLSEYRYNVAVLGAGMQQVPFETLKVQLQEILQMAEQEFEGDIGLPEPRLEPSYGNGSQENVAAGLRLTKDTAIETAMKVILRREDLSEGQRAELELLFDGQGVSALREKYSQSLSAARESKPRKPKSRL
ncbi:hypothetical protein IPG41_02500 [Candidatus Peregrinibacteria bacterium]|nr:MAG: hypothetical protein IPG41_02500 [Candidatus Peregrinibacteria bacterium]